MLNRAPIHVCPFHKNMCTMVVIMNHTGHVMHNLWSLSNFSVEIIIMKCICT